MQKSAIGLVLQDNITNVFVWTWLFWASALMRTLHIHWKYLIVGLPELYTTCPAMCLLMKYTELEYFNTYIIKLLIN